MTGHGGPSFTAPQISDLGGSPVHPGHLPWDFAHRQGADPKKLPAPAPTAGAPGRRGGAGRHPSETYMGFNAKKRCFWTAHVSIVLFFLLLRLHGSPMTALR